MRVMKLGEYEKVSYETYKILKDESSIKYVLKS